MLLPIGQSADCLIGIGNDGFEPLLTPGKSERYAGD